MGRSRKDRKPVTSRQAQQMTIDEARIVVALDGKPWEVFHCTPASLMELAVGSLYLRGIISGPEEICCDPFHEQSLSINLRRTAHSAANRSAGRSRAYPVKGASVPPCSLDRLKEAAAGMFSMADIYRKSGGVHCSALFDGEKIVAFMEDIGRHNAMDKVTGKALMEGRDLSRLVYLTSGRVNAEIIGKARRAGFPLVVSRSMASSIALEEALEYGIGLIGRIEWEKPILYTVREDEGSIRFA
jgi:FdhD protein